MNNTSRYPKPPVHREEASPAVRPDRFAWSDGEALLIFSSSSPSMIREIFLDEGRCGKIGPSILVGGRYNPRIDDVPAALEAARAALKDRFVIIERSAQFYMQCLCKDSGWLLEKREGDAERHFRAIAKSPARPMGQGKADLMARIFGEQQQPSYYLEFAEVLDAMSCYHGGAPEPAWLGWERIEV